MEWIKTSDRLPNDDGYYLVYETFNNRVADDYFFHNGSGDHWKLFHIHVTHWMPLPEPPTGE
ncbi:DUF551 domain-containing protein [Xenorhabdus hominickii]|uniref:Phage protein n=1 Tax=Xenorhabdus hominickii TaxID=351679 RepID=A0A2G0QBA7_XENHO|nr:DUF551 domain-containing protein [Xenorhabdus hominickii]AOM40529.1 hypothetical protein A9255_07985 [Xenorhabdus hominickii]PHM56525.1 phage protein [Xenorhabdus hominickii]